MLEEVANLKGSWGALPQGPKKPVWIGERGTLYAPKMRYRIAAVSVLQLCLQAAAQKARDLSSQDVPSVTIRPAAPKGWRCRDTTTSAPPTLVVRRAPPETPVPPLPALQAQVIRGEPPAGSGRSATRRAGRCARSLQRSLAPRAPGDGQWRPGLAHSREGHWCRGPAAPNWQRRVLGSRLQVP
ncbi:uncharacterized protein LOC122448613 isoform X2 [Cervus canadensis]|uniref:uncharacterized protein LOC122448613 isoform X2 n=1 Tax=Cervus canadensis TaxID=1574408 RepID=UPI001C9E814A|nr:uncharacterized protein LOC122448613 isoform X2 [Cervus canadensis]